MASELEVARMLAGRDRAETHPGTAGSVTIAGTALEDSSGGSVLVDLGGETVSEDGTQPVTVPATVDVRAGDVVRVTLDGVPGSGRRPTVTGVVGGGDRTRADVDNAVSDASQAVDTAGKASETAATAKQSADAAMTEAKDAKSTATDASLRLTQTRDGLEASIRTVGQRASDAGDLADQTATILKEEIELRRSWLRAGEVDGKPALTLGTTATKRVGVLTNEGLDFVNGDTTVASVGEHFFMQSAEVTGELLVGGFMAFPRSDGGVSVKWIGVS